MWKMAEHHQHYILEISLNYSDKWEDKKKNNGQGICYNWGKEGYKSGGMMGEEEEGGEGDKIQDQRSTIQKAEKKI